MNYAKSLREIVMEADTHTHITQIKSMRQVVKESQAIPRYALALVASLAIAGFSLAVLGVFCTTNYSVSKRQQELVTRIACGATPANIISLLLRTSMSLTWIGLLGGIAVVAWLVAKQMVHQMPYDQMFAVLLVTSLPLVIATGTASLWAAVRFTKSASS